MKAYDFETLDVFTDAKFAGNQLAVIMDARGLSDDEMQTITREFNLSETTFVLPPEDPANTARVRIFTLGYEMPFAGHPTVGTAIAIARARNLSGEVKLELNTGLFPVRLDMGGPAPFAEFCNPNLPAEEGAAPSAEALEAALGLPQGAVDRKRHRPRSISAGAVYVYVCAELEAVRGARLNSSAFDALGFDQTVGVYLYAAGGDAPDADYHARMFAPTAGIAEDPATGSAAAALPGQIARAETLSDGEHRWVIEQGYEIGRPSRIIATVETANGAVQSVRIGGAAVPVQTGQIFV
ncbi:MAG: PhzF family phenazine biosynthesis protein [Alphaproteobacteria bacterium]|nr:PhzF family phenazine biosynthesis protein [Alphaproteobacteria bacterium]